MVVGLVDPKNDLKALLERRMTSLIRAALREHLPCCQVPTLAGYRLDKLKQDFAVGAAVLGSMCCLLTHHR